MAPIPDPEEGGAVPTPSAPEDVRRGHLARLRIESLAFGGRGVAHVGRYAVFVDGGLPGQEVAARIVKRRREYAEAFVSEVLVPSPDQVEPRCAHFGLCGGCAAQHFRYQAQLDAKTRQVREVLERIGGLPRFEVEPAVPSPEIFGYRNKMEFTFSRRRWAATREEAALAGREDVVALGLHPRHHYDATLDIEECHLASPRFSQTVRLVRRLAAGSGLAAYSTGSHAGFWRHLVLREGKRSGDFLVNLVTNRFVPGGLEDAAVRAVAEAVAGDVPGVSGVVVNLTARHASAAYGEEERLLIGRATIREELGGIAFEVSAASFFQTNTLQAERLFGRLIERAGLTGREVVYDLYCGAGAISLLVARHAALVVGIEGGEAAIADANRTAAINGIGNCRFRAGDMRDALRDPGIASLPKPDVIILDPPRAGAHPRALADIASLSPAKVLYVSCNPATLARDVVLLAGAGYRVESVEPFDMFPHTPHIEVLSVLAR